MASEETEYESDPEEAKMSLKMRRREASDDEDDDDEEDDHDDHHDDVVNGHEVEQVVRERERDPRDSVVVSEGESDGQADYYNDEEEEEEEEEEEYYEEEEEREIDGGEAEVGRAGEEEAVEGKGGEGRGESKEGEGEGGGGEGEEGEKKEAEPFAVPTSGAFYMHDDRFRDNNAGRNRRTFGGRKLWESKDDKKWGHDKFEEMHVQDRHYDEGRRSSKGNFRGRGRGRGVDRGYARGNRTRGYGGSSNQNSVPKDVRGRGPRRYQPSMKKSETLSPQIKQSANSAEKTFHAVSGRNSASTVNSNVDREPAAAAKVASSLNSASPPFYPSGSSSKDVSLSQKKDVQAGNHNRNLRPTVVDHNVSIPVTNSLVRGKNVIDSAGMDKLRIDGSISPGTTKPLNNVHLPSSASSSLSVTQMPHSRPQGRAAALSGSAMFQQPQTNNQVTRVPSPAPQPLQRNPVQNRGQPSLQAPGQQLNQRPLGASQGSPPEAGKEAVQGTGRGSLVYGGSQVMGSGGNTGAGPGDQNFPTFFPVMQFGAQHPGGIPAVGMAFPGYVAQPNGLGNSEMTWLPVLASAAGALGATYCPPFAVDGAYNPRPTGQTSALPAPSKDNNPSKSNNDSKPQQRSEVTNDEYSQRQNKPRRYSEMNISQ